jgi:SAM-dependent methyltransferase
VRRVIPPFGPEQIEEARDSFQEAARSCIRSLERALSAIGRDLTEFKRILDFGCGPGRLMRHLGPLAAHAELHGVDIDPVTIEWCKNNIPFATFVSGPHEPPLPYGPDTFDLIFNHSVFTHLDEPRQDLWLAELRRILKPGGIALLTVHSTRQWNRAIADISNAGDDPDGYRSRLEGDGILFIADDSFVGSTHPDWYHTTFHAPWYVHEHWTRFLAIRAYIHEGSDTQDMVVLERPVANHPIGRQIGHQRASEPVLTGQAGTRSSRTESLKLRRRDLSRVVRRLIRFRTGSASCSGAAAEFEQPISHSAKRELLMMRVSLYEQAERISVIERELRSEIAALRGRSETRPADGH